MTQHAAVHDTLVSMLSKVSLTMTFVWEHTLYLAYLICILTQRHDSNLCPHA